MTKVVQVSYTEFKDAQQAALQPGAQQRSQVAAPAATQLSVVPPLHIAASPATFYTPQKYAFATSVSVLLLVE